MSSYQDDTERQLAFDQLTQRVDSLEEELSTARAALNSNMGSGRTLEEINTTLQQILQGGSMSSASGRNNISFSNTILGSAIGHKLSEALPMHGQQAFLAFAGATKGFSKVIGDLAGGALTLSKMGEAGLAGFAALQGYAKLNQAMLQSGAVTGQGANTGYSQLTKAVQFGWQSLINPFALTSVQFADEIIGTFRSAGFKDSLAYSLSSSVVNLNNTMGEHLTKMVLPIITDFATQVANQTVTLANYAVNVSNAVSAFSANLKGLQQASKNTNASAPEQLANFATIYNAIGQQGFPGLGTGKAVSEFVNSLTNPAQYGLTPPPGQNAQGAFGKAVVSLANAGLLQQFTSIPPFQSFATVENQKETLNAFPSFFRERAQQMLGIRPASYWLKNPQERHKYETALMLWLNSIPGFAGTMTPADVDKMITFFMSGGNAGLSTSTNFLEHMPSQMNALGDIDKRMFSVRTRYGSTISKGATGRFLDQNVGEKNFNKLLKESGITGISYDSFKQMYEQHPNMNVAQWLEAENIRNQIKTSVIPELAREGVKGPSLAKAQALLEKVAELYENNALANKTSNSDFQREIATNFQALITFTGSNTAFDKALAKKVQTVLKQNGKVIQNKQQMNT